MTKTELIRVQTKNIIELLENEFNAIDFDNDQGSYFTFFIGVKIESVKIVPIGEEDFLFSSAGT